MTSGSMIADAAGVCMKYADRLLKDIPDDRFARFSEPGGQQIVANHPAFIFGHLCLYPQKVLEFLGQDTSPTEVPENYESLFSKTATCEDDPDGEKYPSQIELTEAFRTTYAAAIVALREATEEQLAAPNPVDTPMKEICPTLGSLLNFYMTGHVATHLGQLSTWRRMENMQPA